MKATKNKRDAAPEILDWTCGIGDDMTRAIAEFNRLCEAPPDVPVRVEIGPEMARWMLATINPVNRAIRQSNLGSLKRAMESGGFVYTGDSLKVSTSGRLIDGQHRLQACREVGRSFQTLIAFGVADEVIEVVDTGAKRTPGDVLDISGIAQSRKVAGAIRVALMIERASVRVELSNHEALDLATGRMAGITEWLPLAGKMRRGKGIPDSLTAGLAFAIAATNKAAAIAFFEAWMHGMREGRDAGFNALETRISTAKRDGVLTRNHILAFMIATFNAWANDRVVARALLHWNSRKSLPVLWSSERPADTAGEAEQRWTAADLSELRRLHEQGLTWRQISKALGRSPGACRFRYQDMTRVVEIETAAPARPWPF